jgi:hypothetical protein
MYKMNEQKQKEACAGLEGIQIDFKGYGVNWACLWDGYIKGKRVRVPTYDTHDDMQRLLKTLRLSELRKIKKLLPEIIERDNNRPYIKGQDLIAEACQLREALLKAKGLWEEE